MWSPTLCWFLVFLANLFFNFFKISYFMWFVKLTKNFKSFVWYVSTQNTSNERNFIKVFFESRKYKKHCWRSQNFIKINKLRLELYKTSFGMFLQVNLISIHSVPLSKILFIWIMNKFLIIFKRLQSVLLNSKFFLKNFSVQKGRFFQENIRVLGKTP